jgi:hypothetical protein
MSILDCLSFISPWNRAMILGRRLCGSAVLMFLSCLLLLGTTAEAAPNFPYYVGGINLPNNGYAPHPRTWTVSPWPDEGYGYMFYDLVWHDWGRATTVANGMINLCTQQLTQCHRGTVTVRLNHVEPAPESHEYCWMTITKSSIKYAVGLVGNPSVDIGLCLMRTWPS